ncbi:MAG: DNA polymerase/3'-5' exonuclease PolX [Bacteroidia bacterium]|nr:DNA polymerase/3'-5' exonuclease PolX [Bacteroidia bacterium]
MTNKEIASKFNELAKIMELHGENKFKIRSYANAYVQLRKIDRSLFEMTQEEIVSIKGVGKAIAEKIIQLKENGTIETYERYKAQTPPGVIKMLSIKGFGPKKISTIWKEMGIESLGELLYACNENRLIEIKGFGAKTQEELKKNVEFFLKSEHKYRFADIENIAKEVEDILLKSTRGKLWRVGDLHRKENVINDLTFVTTSESIPESTSEFSVERSSKGVVKAIFQDAYSVTIIQTSEEDLDDQIFKLTYSNELQKLGKTEQDVLSRLGLKSVIPEMKNLRIEDFEILTRLQGTILEEEDIRGVVHTHSTYSDGIHTLEEMAMGAINRGYEYLVISDHSKSAFYAGGLKEEDLIRQWKEIDELNTRLTDFYIFKSIESDILNDGSLDYDDEILSQFDLVIASVHSNLKMDLEKATSRLIRAIEHPATSILGHPTGRLLLSRRGYPIDHRKVIDACSANGVAIELNANPFRLDLDWSWIPYAMSKGVMIAINPDAHSVNGIDHIHYGVISARKGGLLKEYCLNALNLEKIRRFLQTEWK